VNYEHKEHFEIKKKNLKNRPNKIKTKYEIYQIYSQLFLIQICETSIMRHAAL